MIAAIVVWVLAVTGLLVLLKFIPRDYALKAGQRMAVWSVAVVLCLVALGASWRIWDAWVEWLA